MAKFYAKAPDGTDATLSITVEGFTQSLQQNGWCKMPNGLILQWGRTNSSINYYESLSTFSITHSTTFVSLGTILADTWESANNYDDGVKFTSSSVSFQYEAHWWITIGV